MFFSLAGRHDEYKSRGLKIENLDLHGLAGGRLAVAVCASQRIVFG